MIYTNLWLRLFAALFTAVVITACSDNSKTETVYVMDDSASDSTSNSGTDSETDLCAGVTCEAMDQCHKAGVCEPSTGECSNPVIADGSGCDDNNVCTYGETCQAGVCSAEGDVVCSPLDDCHKAGKCDPETGCSNPVKENGASCGDNNACTSDDHCEEGVCTGDIKKCEVVDDCLESAVCNSATGECEGVPKPDGTSCTSAVVTELCQEAVCQSGSCVAAEKACEPTDGCHYAGVCDGTTGKCSNPVKNDGATCDDGNMCTESETCISGVCEGGTQITCLPTDACHLVDSCNPAVGCVEIPAADGTSCDDGNPCTMSDECSEGICASANPVVCQSDNPCKINGTCDTLTGQCNYTNLPDNTSCNDNDVCTVGTVCKAGECEGGGLVTCPAPDACHLEGACDPVNGCSNLTKPDDTPCEDTDKCTLVSTCQSGVCEADTDTDADTSYKQCTDLGQCYKLGTCVPETGVCTNPYETKGTLCDDDNLCTKSDACDQGVCVGSNPVVCQSGSILCRDNIRCDPGTGECFGDIQADGTSCNDGDFCTSSAECKSGVCERVAERVCTASDATCFSGGSCDEVGEYCVEDLLFTGSSCTEGACFADISATSGITWRSADSSTILSPVGGAVLDYDNDGYMDIVIAGEGGNIARFHNNGDSTFDFVISEDAFGTLINNDTITGVAAADVDNDGDTDLYVLTKNANILLINNAGAFAVSANSGCEGGAGEYSTSASFGDYNNDGWLDLYVTNISAGGLLNAPVTDRLFLADGDGTFTDVTATALPASNGFAMDSRWSDVDGDGFIDLQICNDLKTGVTSQASKVLLNQAGVSFAAMSVTSVNNKGCLSMASGDYNNDGLPDVYRGQKGDNLLMEAELLTDTDSDTTVVPDSYDYTDATTASGSGAGEYACTSKLLAARSVIFEDFNNDGWIDIYAANGDYQGDLTVEQNSGNILLLNDGTGGFTDVSLSAGVADTRDARGVLTADIDNDGDVDLIVLNYNAEPVVYKNSATSVAWMAVDLEGTTSNKDGYGAVVEVSSFSGIQTKELQNSCGPGTTCDNRLFFGLGTDVSATITVYWPSGTTQTLNSQAANTTHTIIETP
ncbi:MAG: CRTAC1 family protein [Deltaproteobacteria bacterium]|nr:CRTAC1 family protein [Deltaproteobacteria bacterium]